MVHLYSELDSALLEYCVASTFYLCCNRFNETFKTGTVEIKLCDEFQNVWKRLRKTIILGASLGAHI